VKTRNLVPPSPALPAEDAPQTPAPAAPAPEKYAIVADRGPDGTPTRLGLPAPIVGSRVQLYAQRADGTPCWVAEVLADGTLKSDGHREAELAALKPGVRIVAAADMAGNILALQAMARIGQEDKPKRQAPSSKAQRTASPAEEGTLTRASNDKYAHNPRELLYSGHVGRVISVR
jgi:hypothetical protein